MSRRTSNLAVLETSGADTAGGDAITTCCARGATVLVLVGAARALTAWLQARRRERARQTLR